MILFSKNKKGYMGFGKLTLALVLFFVAGFSFSQRSYAATNPWGFLSDLKDGVSALCNPTQAMFAHIAEDQPQQSIVRFAYNYDTTRYLKLFYNMFGMSIDNAIRCFSQIPIINQSVVGTACTVFTGAPANPEICKSMVFGIASSDREGRMAFANSPVSGSLLGLYHQVEDVQRHADPPPNLAFFAGEELKHVPFVGKALAQADTNYKGFFITKVYFGWKFVRNIAFGLMALVMLVIGIMMINRTKVSSQTIVTLQYALPKVIIAMIMIAFSYPIAATLTNVFFILSLKAPAIVVTTAVAELSEIDLSSFINPAGTFNVVPLLFYIFMSVVQIGTLGPVLFLLWAVAALIIMIQSLIIMIKWLLTYVKMLIEIVLSPVDLFLSALPGSEEKGSGESKVVKWFKKFLAYGLSMIVLTAMPPLVYFIALSILVSGAVNTPQSLEMLGANIPLPAMSQMGTQGIGFDLTIGIMVIIMGLSMTSKIPGQIQYVLMGDTPKTRK